MTRATRCFAAVALSSFAVAATAATYRCEVAGRVTYGDRPCADGRQSVVESADDVDPAERAAAARRLRDDKAALAENDRLRDRERRQDLLAAAAARRRDGDGAKHAQACAKLARRVRNAHDDFEIAGPRDQPKMRLKMQHAEQDFAALCRR